MKKTMNLPMEELKNKTIEALDDRGVTLNDLGDLVYFLQGSYFDDLTMDDCIDSIEKVLSKREVCHAVLTGIAMDVAGENGDLEEPLLSIVRNDDKLFGVDETLPLSILNIYGSISLTNFGYLDRVKTGIIGELDSSEERVNTFLDDIVAALAAAASARLAHTFNHHE